MPLDLPPRQTPLSLQQMRDIVSRGRSVLYNGRVINKPADLPDPVELVLGRPEDLARTEEDIDAQLAALAEQKKRIEQARKDSEKAGKEQAEISGQLGDARQEQAILSAEAVGKALQAARIGQLEAEVAKAEAEVQLAQLYEKNAKSDDQKGAARQSTIAAKERLEEAKKALARGQDAVPVAEEPRSYIELPPTPVKEEATEPEEDGGKQESEEEKP